MRQSYKFMENLGFIAMRCLLYDACSGQSSLTTSRSIVLLLAPAILSKFDPKENVGAACGERFWCVDTMPQINGSFNLQCQN